MTRSLTAPLLLGTVASGYDHQWLFGTGAILASLMWFTALGFGAHKLAPLLSRPQAWRVLDGVIAVVMVVLAGVLVWG